MYFNHILDSSILNTQMSSRQQSKDQQLQSSQSTFLQQQQNVIFQQNRLGSSSNNEENSFISSSVPSPILPTDSLFRILSQSNRIDMIVNQTEEDEIKVDNQKNDNLLQMSPIQDLLQTDSFKQQRQENQNIQEQQFPVNLQSIKNQTSICFNLPKLMKQEESIRNSLNPELLKSQRQQSNSIDKKQQHQNQPDKLFTKEDMQMKVDYCEKVNFVKMNRYLSYMKNNNILKNILDSHKKLVTPSSNISNYLNQVQKNKSQTNPINNVLENQSNSQINSHTFYNNSPEKKLISLNNQSANQVQQHTSRSNQQIDSTTRQEITRLQYLNQIQKQNKEIKSMTSSQFYSPKTPQTLSQLLNQTPQSQNQMKYLQRSKKQSPATFFQDLFLKNKQNKLQDATNTLSSFTNRISKNRQNITLDWQQKIVLKDNKFLNKINKQESNGSSLDRFIENKFMDQSQKQSSFNNHSNSSTHTKSQSLNNGSAFFNNNSIDSVLEIPFKESLNQQQTKQQKIQQLRIKNKFHSLIGQPTSNISPQINFNQLFSQRNQIQKYIL